MAERMDSQIPDRLSNEPIKSRHTIHPTDALWRRASRNRRWGGLPVSWRVPNNESPGTREIDYGS
jgi:hypothetical protein